MTIIKLEDKEFSRKNSVKVFDNINDNTYKVLSYIGHVRLHRDDPRMIKIMESNEFEIIVDKPMTTWKKYHTNMVKFSKCCKCAWSPSAEIINMQINYNEVTVMGIESKRDFLINKIIK